MNWNKRDIYMWINFIKEKLNSLDNLENQADLLGQLEDFNNAINNTDFDKKEED